MIYFIQQGMDGEIKIGFTASHTADDRLKILQTASPKKLYLLATTNGDIQKEHSLHKRFSKCQLHGEWFAPTEELLSFIEDIKDHPQTKPPLKELITITRWDGWLEHRLIDVHGDIQHIFVINPNEGTESEEQKAENAEAVTCA